MDEPVDVYEGIEFHYGLRLYLAGEGHGEIAAVPGAAAGVDEAILLVRAAGVVAEIVLHLRNNGG
jgi:hypothetical protein